MATRAHLSERRRPALREPPPVSDCLADTYPAFLCCHRQLLRDLSDRRWLRSTEYFPLPRLRNRRLVGPRPPDHRTTAATLSRLRHSAWQSRHAILDLGGRWRAHI